MSDDTAPLEPAGQDQPADNPPTKNGKRRKDRKRRDRQNEQRERGRKTVHLFGYIRHPKKRAFLRALVETGTVVRAAQAADIDRSTLYTPQWRGDPDFQQAVEEARVMAADIMEEEAFRRAVEGVRKPVGWHKGEPGGYVQEYSDNLLMFSLKGVLPDKYRENVAFYEGRFKINWHQLAAVQGGQAMIARIAAGEDVRAVLVGVLDQLQQAGIVQYDEPKRLGPGKDPK